MDEVRIFTKTFRAIIGALLLFCAAAIISLLDRPSTAQISSSTARHIVSGTTLPANCKSSSGDVYFKTSTIVGIYECVSDTWVLIGSGGGATGVSACGSGTIDFSAISPLGYATGTFTLTGTAANDTLAIKLPASLEAGLIVTMRSTAANTVTVTAYNLSGGTIDPASNTFGACVVALP